MSFTRIFYDNYKNRLYCIENVDGKRRKIDFHPQFEYYVPNKSGSSEFHDIYGNPVKLMTSKTRKDMKHVSENVKTCETDIGEDIKFLQNRYKGQNLKADIKNFQIATLDIEVAAKDQFPEPNEANYPINLISIYYSKLDQVYTYGLQPYTGNSKLVKNYHYFKNEKDLIERFITDFRKQRVDIISGWNSRLFDLPYIINRCNKLDINVSLSPINIYRESKAGGYHISSGGYDIAGISILDGLDLYKNFVYENRERYSLQAIGMFEVGEGKKDLEGTVNNAWETNWNAFVEYNVQDVLLTKKIEEKKKHIELTINFCYQALIPFNKIFSSISLITGYVMKYLHERNMVLPDRSGEKKDDKIPGAYVMAKPGFYKWICSFDIASMYPHLIIMYNISPETLVLNSENTNEYYKTPLTEYKTWDTADGDFKIGGIQYRKDKKGIIAEIVEDTYKKRKRLKTKGFIVDAIENNRSLEKYPDELIKEVNEEGETSEYYNSQQLIRKILLNSYYGVLNNEYFNLFNIHNSLTITLGGQHLIKYLSNTLNSYMKSNWHKVGPKLFPNTNCKWTPLEKDVVILIDTDSNFICMDEIIQNMGIDFKDNKDFLDWVNYLNEKLFNPFFEKILQIYADKFEVPQIIEFKREKIITQKFILAKKKYADEIIANEDKIYIDEPKISITGIEIVRTDTPKFSRERIMNVVKEIFKVKGKDREKVINKLRDIHEDFLKAEPTDIAIPKGVKDYQKFAEPIETYVAKGKLNYPKHLPIHVRASMNYNFIVAKNKLPFMYINNGTKMKYIHVSSSKNELSQNVIGFINEWPKEFNDMFMIDKDAQWNRVFQNVIQRFFNGLGWGDIKLEENTLDELIQF